jgi:hypothetical protein
MDFPTEVSPGKFDTLPEVLRSRIIRESGAGTVTGQHRELTLTDRIIDAGTKPFSKEDVKWLTTVRRDIMICYITDEPRRYASKIGRKLLLVSMDTKYERKVMGMRYINIDLSMKENKVNYSTFLETWKPPIEKIEEILPGCRDTRIITNRDIFLSYGEKEYTLLTDIRSVFLMLRRRFMIILPNNAINKAREWTQDVLDIIVDDLWEENLHTLLPYLVGNAIYLELEINMNDYIIFADIEMDDVFIKDTEEKCEELYDKISYAIKQMI